MSDKKPLVTIRCITYNHEPYIRQCLEGFVMQKTNFPFEAIVHDDASTDGTAAIIREYAEKYPDIIKPIYETENQYSKHDGSLRKIMDAQTHGKYVALCEGDDYWIDPLKLQKQVDFLEENSSYGLVHTNYYVLKKDKLESKSSKFKSDDVLRQLILGEYPIATLTVLFRNDLYRKIPKYYETQKFLMGDLPLWIEMAKDTNFGYLNYCTSCYRITLGSASHPKSLIKSISFLNSSFECRFYYRNKFHLFDISEHLLLCKKYKAQLVLGWRYHSMKLILKNIYKLIYLYLR